jgi:8-oxo-dGTP diphosphatase
MRMIDVVVGMIRRPGGPLLMASRPQGKPYEGYWEFPGGKVEVNETPQAALIRELKEELNITAGQCSFAWQLEHEYAHASVRLHFFWVTEWQGAVSTMEGQQVLWVHEGDAWPYPVLPATVPLLEKISGK